MSVPVIVEFEPIHIPHDECEGGVFFVSVAFFLEFFDHLLVEGFGPEKSGESIELDEVELCDRDGNVFGEFEEDIFVLLGEDFVVGISFSGFVVDFEDAYDLCVVHDGHGEDAFKGRLEAFFVTLGEHLVEIELDGVDDFPFEGHVGCKILRIDEDGVLGCLRVGKDVAVPDEWFEVFAECFVDIEEIDGDALGFDEAFDLVRNVEDVCDVVRNIEFFDYIIEFLFLFFKPVVFGFDDDAFFELGDDRFVDEGFDLFDLGESFGHFDLVDLGCIAEGFDLDLEDRVFDGGVERAEKIRIVFFVGGGDDVVGVACGGPLFDELFECGFGLASDEDRGCGFEEAFEEGVVGEGFVSGDDVEVDRFEEADGFDDILSGVDAAGRAGEVSDEVAVLTIFIEDEDVDTLGRILSLFVFRRKTFVLQAFEPRRRTYGDVDKKGNQFWLSPKLLYNFLPTQSQIFF